MATSAQLKTILEGVTGIKKVFDDGEIYDSLRRVRSVLHMPYIEMRRDVDYTEHTSDTRQRRESVECVVAVMDRRDNMNTIKSSILAQFLKRGSDQMHADIVGYRTEGRFRFMRFTVDFFGTDSKTA